MAQSSINLTTLDFDSIKNNLKTYLKSQSIFRDYDFGLVLKPNERTFEFQKRLEDESGEDIDLLFGYPYVLLSDTLQRMIFYTIAIESNENSTLIFEEPESHAFPDYTFHLGEKIAFDEKNQYFLATHDPYLFLAILEKAPKDDVNVFITYFEDYQTKVKCLDDEEKSNLQIILCIFRAINTLRSKNLLCEDDTLCIITNVLTAIINIIQCVS